MSRHRDPGNDWDLMMCVWNTSSPPQLTTIPTRFHVVIVDHRLKSFKVWGGVMKEKPQIKGNPKTRTLEELETSGTYNYSKH